MMENFTPKVTASSNVKLQRTSACGDVIESVCGPSFSKSRADEHQQNAYSSLLSDYNKLKVEFDELKLQLEAAMKEKSVTARPAQEIRRQKDSAKLWRGKYLSIKQNYNRAMRSLGDLKSSQKKVGRLMSHITSQKFYHKRMMETMQVRVNEANCHNICKKKEHDLNEHIAHLENIITTMEDNQNTDNMQTKEGGIYNSNLRKSIYFALEHGCPVDHAGKVVNFIVREFTGKNLESVPCAATVARMCREMGTLSDLQSGEALLKSTNTTIAWDATELKGSHINEVHVAVPSDSSLHPTRDYHTLSVAPLAGGTTKDYTDHIVDSVKEAAETYSDWTGQESGDVVSSIQSHITASLSDRVAVNHCVSEALKDVFNSELLELHCNVHPLDSLASKARAALLQTGVKGAVFSKDCAAANLILGISKMRYKQGTGDPLHFKSFLSDQKIPLSMIPRYVGSRLHIVFHLAGTIFHLQAKLLDFLIKYCASRGGFAAALIKDLQDKDILDHLQVLELVGKYVTGPWMSLLYCEDEPNLHSSVHLKKCAATLADLVHTPSNLQLSRYDAFGQELDNSTDQVLQSLVIATPLNLNCVKAVATAMKAVCERQLSFYLKGDFTPQQNEMARAAPAHNMQAERIMAMCDSYTRRMPNSRPDYREARLKSRSNNTLNWLDGLEKGQLESAINFARAKGREASLQKRVREEKVKKEILKRMKLKSRKKDETLRRKVERQVIQLEKDPNPSLSKVKQLLELAGTSAQEEVVPFIHTLLTTPNQALAQRFLHTWYDTESDEDTVFNGKIMKKKKKIKVTFVVAYYNMDEEEAAAVDYDMERSQLIADALYGDLVLLELPAQSEL